MEVTDQFGPEQKGGVGLSQRHPVNNSQRVL
jgi:hypothetical protein